MRSPSDAVSQPDPIVVLTQAEALLHRAASVAWARAEREGSLSRSLDVAHGIHLAAALAASLLSEVGLAVAPAEPDALETDVVQGLRQVEARLRAVPPESLPPGSAQLLVMLADLIREAEA